MAIATGCRNGLFGALRLTLSGRPGGRLATPTSPLKNASFEIRKGEVHAPNAATWASNIAASAHTKRLASLATR